jgi:hypothetical protein
MPQRPPRQRLSSNALVSSKRSLFTGWPETGLEEINLRSPESDFWTTSSESA